MSRWKTLLRSSTLWTFVAFVVALWSGGLLFAQGFDLRDDGWWLLGAQNARGLHGSIQLEEASGRFMLLHAVMTLFGESARSLVWLRAVLSALCGSAVFALLFHGGRRVGAWVALAAVLALGPPPPWLLPPLILVLGLETRKWRLAASAVAAACAFGVGSFALCLLVSVCAWPRSSEDKPLRWPWIGIAAGVVLVCVIGWQAGGIARELDAGWRRPVERMLTTLGSGAAWNWWHSMRGGPLLGLPFAELHSGAEIQPLFGGHSAVRAWSFRALYLFVFAAAIAATARALQRRRGGAGLALCVAGAAVLIARGDLIQLRAASVLAFPGWLFLAGRLRAARWILFVLALPLVAPLAERAWLIAHHYRSTLLHWDTARAEILLDPATIREIESLNERLPGRGDPMVVWPNAPGLHWLLERPPGTRYVRQPPADRSAEIIDEMRRSEVAAVLLGPECLRGPRSLAVLQADLHEHLRTHFQVNGSATVLGQSFRLLAPLPQGIALDDLSLAQRMPVAEMGVGTERTPALREGLAVGQSFRMGSTDFRGFSLRWQTSRDGVVLPLRFHLWLKDGERYDTLLHFFDADIEIESSGERSTMRVGPLPDTANRELALSFNLREPIDFVAEALWHRHDTGRGDVDFYPLGSAMINDEEVAADLYFAIY